jgi:hypothetical protein
MVPLSKAINSTSLEVLIDIISRVAMSNCDPSNIGSGRRLNKYKEREAIWRYLQWDKYKLVDENALGTHSKKTFADDGNPNGRNSRRGRNSPTATTQQPVNN